MAREGKIAVVTVHGTGDTATTLDGPKWFQRGSSFVQALSAKLAASGLDVDIHPHLWSGANSAAERERGAERLAPLLKRLGGQYESVHVIGHSHGGNVANEAALHLRWGMKRRKNEPMHSLITVGTPFLALRAGFLQTLAGMLFLALTWGSIVAVPVLALGAWVNGDLTENVAGFLVLIAIVGLCSLFMLSMSRRGARRILRPRKAVATERPMYAIWHENDEAISFLRRVEELPIEPFPEGALFRGSRSAAISWGVFAVIVVSLILPSLYAVGWFDAFGVDTTASAGRGVDIFASIMLGLLIAPIVFVAVYLGYRFIVGGVAEIGVRRPVNGWVGGVLRGIAMGRDGDQFLGQVSTESHTHQTESRKLEGEVVQRMQAAAAASADKLIDKYRWSLFTVGADSNAPLTDLATDAMTWDSLIHTTYFDQPEVVDLIAAHIVARAGALN
ncbi:MAG: hypothetical protein K2P58_14060 [Hyphomonadaceae bacterium]|nr:hypothetical protein [Hyphomonadaceae bacterium]